jgi:hypothetical protein
MPSLLHGRGLYHPAILAAKDAVPLGSVHHSTSACDEGRGAHTSCGRCVCSGMGRRSWGSCARAWGHSYLWGDWVMTTRSHHCQQANVISPERDTQTVSRYTTPWESQSLARRNGGSTRLVSPKLGAVSRFRYPLLPPGLANLTSAGIPGFSK